jgi:hypothetical protein
MNLLVKKEQENQKKLFTKLNKLHMQNPQTLKRIFIIAFALISIMLFSTSCADPQHQVKTYVTGYEYGFLFGAWHGTIAPLSFIGSLFSDDISIYAVNNSGRWYDFGYIIGLVGVMKLISLLVNLIIIILGGKVK